MPEIIKLAASLPKSVAKKKVAAYARVSIESLHHSFMAQVVNYKGVILANPEWDFAGVYADEGASGVSAAKRDGFQRMLEDCRAGKIDIILTKSISRFARNTVDLLNTVRELKSLGIEVRFERENICSLSGDGELMLSILASFAQEESRSIGENIRWAALKNFQQGKPHCKFHVYGYRWEGDRLKIEPTEAAVVRRIFQEFSDGKSLSEIKNGLNADGIPNYRGGRWPSSSISYILGNVTYTGDLLFQKEYSIDAVSQKRKKNTGEMPQYLVREAHEPVIGRDVFDRVQAMRAEEAKKAAHLKRMGVQSNQPRIYCFSGKIKCGSCGRNYCHCVRRGISLWKCLSQKGHGRTNCGARLFSEDTLEDMCRDVLGLEEFDEATFAERIEKIVVADKKNVEFHFYGGGVAIRPWTRTAKRKDSVPDREAAWKEYMLCGGVRGTGVDFKEWRVKNAIGNDDTGDD